MTLPYLMEDCIYNILKYLQQYYSTLFSCLLVNRFWCKTAVPLLYADPFANENYLIIWTLILCFNEEEILQLQNELKLINNNSIIINEYKPLFEYPKYLKNFNSSTIKKKISQWLNKDIPPYCQHDGKIYDHFISIFYKSILRRCNNIKKLDTSFVGYNYILMSISNITILKLNSLTLHLYEKDGEDTQKFLRIIMNTCLNLRKLEIFSFSADYTNTNNNVKEKLCSIVQKQNNLEIIRLSSCCQSFLNDIFLSLEFQRHSLIYVELQRIDFDSISFKNFINLYNLKYLKFCNCTISDSDRCDILRYASFKLKRLEFFDEPGGGNNNSNNNLSSLIIKYLGTSLQELILLDELNISISGSKLRYCLNLTTLEIEIKSSIDLSVFSYFKNLKIRTLNIHDYYRNDGWNPKGTFKNLANNLPNSVKEVSILNYNSNSQNFKEFLENCHDCLEVIDLINLSEQTEKLEEIQEVLKIILNYIERSNNSLKFLGMIELENVLNDEESKLLEVKGIKIVDFYSIYRRDNYIFNLELC